MLYKAMKKMIDKENERQIAAQAEEQLLVEKGFSKGKGLSDKEKKSIREYTLQRGFLMIWKRFRSKWTASWITFLMMLKV